MDETVTYLDRCTVPKKQTYCNRDDSSGPRSTTTLEKTYLPAPPSQPSRFQSPTRLAPSHAASGGLGPGGGGGGGFGPPSALSIGPAPETLLILRLTPLITGSSITAIVSEIIAAHISFFMKDNLHGQCAKLRSPSNFSLQNVPRSEQDAQ